MELIKIVGDNINFPENFCPSWGAYWALMDVRLIGLNIHTWVQPLGTGETWRYCMAKCVLYVSGAEENEACRTEQIYGGLEAGTEGGIHAT